MTPSGIGTGAAVGVDRHDPTPDQNTKAANQLVDLTTLGTMWRYECANLARYLATGKYGLVIRTRIRIETLGRKAEILGVTNMPHPPIEAEDDPVFVGMEDLWSGRQVEGGSTVTVTARAWSGGAEISGGFDTLRALTSIPKNQLKGEREKVDYMALGKKQVVVEESTLAGGEGNVPVEAATKAPAPVTTMTKADQLKAMRKAKQQANTAATAGAPGQAKVKKAKKEKVMTPCLDGCGALVAGRFAPGHDAKLKSLLLKIERGELGMDQVPDESSEYVKFSKPEITKEEITVGVVKDGKPVLGPDGKQKTVKQTVKTENRQLLLAPVKFPGRPDVQYAETLETGK